MEQGVKFFKRTDFLWLIIGIYLSWIRDAEGLDRIVEDGRSFFDSRREITVHAQNMICDHSVVFFVDVVGDDEKKIETGEKGIRKGDVLVGILVDVVLERTSTSSE